MHNFIYNSFIIDSGQIFDAQFSTEFLLLYNNSWNSIHFCVWNVFHLFNTVITTNCCYLGFFLFTTVIYVLCKNSDFTISFQSEYSFTKFVSLICITVQHKDDECFFTFKKVLLDSCTNVIHKTQTDKFLF